MVVERAASEEVVRRLALTWRINLQVLLAQYHLDFELLQHTGNTLTASRPEQQSAGPSSAQSSCLLDQATWCMSTASATRTSCAPDCGATDTTGSANSSGFLHGKRYTSFGRHFTASEKLEEIIERLHWYIDDGDAVVDTSCGSNEWSTLLAATLEKHGKRQCQFKNFDICETTNPFHFEKKDWFEVSKTDLPSGRNLVLGLNPPFGQLGERAKDFVERMFTFEPRLVILIAPKAAEVKNPRYELLWKDTELLKGQAFYLPGSTDDEGNAVSQHNNDSPPLYLFGRKDYTDKHYAVTVQHNLLQIASGHLPPIMY